MNWTASLLRNELKKQKLAHESRINLLTQASIDVQNFLALEERIAILTAELETDKQSISQLANELKEQAELSSQQIENKETAIKGLEQRISTDKDKIFNLQKEIRDLNLYHQREIKKVQANYQAKVTPLQQQIAELKQSLLSVAQKKLKGKEEQEQLLVQLENQWVREKKQLNQEHLSQITEIKQQVANLEHSTEILTSQNNNLNQQVSILTSQKEQAQTPFEEIETIIKANKILLFPIKKKLKERVKEIKTAFHWGEVAQDWDLGDSRSPTPLPEPEKSKSSKKTKKSLNWKTHGVPFLDFTEELTQQWLNHNFTKLQCQEWLNTGMKASDADFITWLRDIKQKDAEWVLNYGKGEELRKEFESYDRK